MLHFLATHWSAGLEYIDEHPLAVRQGTSAGLEKPFLAWLRACDRRCAGGHWRENRDLRIMSSDLELYGAKGSPRAGPKVDNVCNVWQFVWVADHRSTARKPVPRIFSTIFV